MKRDRMKTVLYAGICAMALAGTSLTSYAETETTSPGAEARMERPEDDGSVMAKILTVDDDSITVYLAAQMEHNGERPELNGERPDQSGDTAPIGQPADTENIPEKPEYSDDTVPAQMENEDGRGGRGMMDFSDETTTLTITDDTVITKGMNQESADISELSADSMVRIVVEDDTVVSIAIMTMETPPAAE